ncbi:hypothetical protein AcV5_008964 [Taiwanofungus camphoratus]|nr:hypothetical protein AcV5_008964 [Antrodia cinnamomea]
MHEEASGGFCIICRSQVRRTSPDFLCCCELPFTRSLSDPNVIPIESSMEYQVLPRVTTTSDIYTPRPAMKPWSSPGEQEQDAEEWEEDISSLLEWVGMACMGAQRLQKNDRTDPYLAVYTPPSPCQIKDVTHVQWTGLLSPAFVQIVMEAVFSPSLNQMTFLSLVGHSIPNTPVTYISPSAPFHSPLRAPRSESEDTWCLIVAKGPNDSETRTGSKWVLAETVGQWDTRWG